jgi:hypothetical protein
LLKLFHAEDIALDFMLDDFHGGVTDLVGRQPFVERREV